MNKPIDKTELTQAEQEVVDFIRKYGGLDTNTIWVRGLDVFAAYRLLKRGVLVRKVRTLYIKA